MGGVLDAYLWHYRSFEMPPGLGAVSTDSRVASLHIKAQTSGGWARS